MPGRNPDKSLKSFPSCYSQSPLQLCLEISISSNSTHAPLMISSVQLLYTVKEKGGKPDRKPYLLSQGLRNPYRKPSSPETSTKLCVHEFGFRLISVTLPREQSNSNIQWVPLCSMQLVAYR
jgi:hypothetical protein